jgi:hypothetical protein
MGNGKATLLRESPVSTSCGRSLTKPWFALNAENNPPSPDNEGAHSRFSHKCFCYNQVALAEQEQNSQIAQEIQ